MQDVKWLKDHLGRGLLTQRPSQIPTQVIRSVLPKSLATRLGMQPHPLPGPGGSVTGTAEQLPHATWVTGLTAPTKTLLNVPHPHPQVLWDSIRKRLRS